ncbi:hypothetical protein Ddc_17226 [Ditylenchus destructor]|nr:hypothetical protein Ddc_17226 [Ditylenchus destructor]
MDGQCCEKLIVPNSNEIAVKRNVWNLFPLDIQLDVFRCLRAYDLYKKAIYVSSQWRNVIEKHKRTLPKFRQLTDCRVQNRLVLGNYDEIWWQKQEELRKKREFREKQRKRREKSIKRYALLIITSSIAAIAAHPICVERISATLLLLAVSLRMGNTYAKYLFDPYKLRYGIYGGGYYEHSGGTYDGRIIERLNPDYQKADQDIQWFSDLSIHINLIAWALAFLQDYIVSKDGMKEAAQNVANEESDTSSTEGNVQLSNDSKDHLRRVFISLGSPSIDTGNGDTQHQHNSPMKMTIRRAIIPDKKRSCSRSSVASPKKKRVPLKDTQSAGPAVDATAHSNQGLSGMNQSSPYSCSGEEVNEGQVVTNGNDQNLNPTTSAENFPAEKLTIALIRFDIGDGRVYYETPEYKMYDGPLSEHLLTLIHSEADVHGCETHFVFASVYGSIFTTHPKTVREEYEKFSQEVHSVSHLWTNGRVKTRLHEYPKHASNVLPVSDFCDILFSRDRSILVCKELEIQLADDWPLSVVSNVAHLCNRFLLKELHHRHQRLRYRFLDALYENELPQQQPLALELFFPNSVEEFMDELKKRFKNSTGQCFKFELLSPRNCVPTNLRCRNKYGSLVTKKIRDDEESSDLDKIIVQQGP